MWRMTDKPLYRFPKDIWEESVTDEFKNKALHLESGNEILVFAVDEKMGIEGEPICVDDMDLMTVAVDWTIGDFTEAYTPTDEEVCRALRGDQGPQGPKGDRGDTAEDVDMETLILTGELTQKARSAERKADTALKLVTAVMEKLLDSFTVHGDEVMNDEKGDK